MLFKFKIENRMAKRILIVEDEFIIGQNLTEILLEFGYEVVAHAFDADEALLVLNANKVDLILLDINLGKGMDGIEFAEVIENQFGLPFVFLTSHADSSTILRAKGCRPLAYLLKPFKKAEIFASLEIAFSHIAAKEAEDVLYVKVGANAVRVCGEEILFLKADRVYIEIHRTKGSPLIVRESLQAWEKKLPDYFKRIGRSYIVNIHKIEKIGRRTLHISNEEISISSQMSQELLKEIGI